MTLFRLLILATALACGESAHVRAASPDHAAWEARLSAARFAEREAATRELAALGEGGFVLLESLAKSPSTEARSRALALLDRAFPTAPETVEPALRRLASSGLASDGAKKILRRIETARGVAAEKATLDAIGLTTPEVNELLVT